MVTSQDDQISENKAGPKNKIILDNFWNPPVLGDWAYHRPRKTTPPGLLYHKPSAIIVLCQQSPGGRFWVSRPPFPGTGMRAELRHKQVHAILFPSMGEIR